jgi:ABC-type nitrate/sulfonate/bicarbonate transport system substrate-binding protein
MTRLLLGVFASLLLVVSCRKLEPLRVVVPLNFSAFLACVSENPLARASHTSEVNVVWVEDTAAALEQLSEGRADLGVISLPAFVAELKEHRDYRIISEILNSTHSTALVVKASSKVLAARQLVGKNVGLVGGAPAEIFLEYFLLTEGVNLGSLRKQSFDRASLVEEFLAGRLDAIVVSEPDLSRMKRDNPTIALREFHSFVHESKSVLVGSEKTLAKDRDRIDRLISSWIEAEAFLVDSPEVAHASIARCLKLDAEAMEMMKPALLVSKSEIKLTNSLRQLFDRSREWEILRGRSKESEIPVFSEVVDQSFLKRLRARAITLGPGA